MVKVVLSFVCAARNSNLKSYLTLKSLAVNLAQFLELKRLMTYGFVILHGALYFKFL